MEKESKRWKFSNFFKKMEFFLENLFQQKYIGISWEKDNNKRHTFKTAWTCLRNWLMLEMQSSNLNCPVSTKK